MPSVPPVISAAFATYDMHRTWTRCDTFDPVESIGRDDIMSNGVRDSHP